MAVTYAQMMQAARSPPSAIAIRIIDHPIESWTRVHDWIEQALGHEQALIGAVDVFNALINRRMTLWGIYDHDHLCAVFVTQIETGSKGRALNIIALGGTGMDDWIESFSAAVTRYARDHQCRFVFEMGRRGWLRVLDKLGWVDGPATMIKVL